VCKEKERAESLDIGDAALKEFDYSRSQIPMI
jgi:hypothetical protein